MQRVEELRARERRDMMRTRDDSRLSERGRRELIYNELQIVDADVENNGIDISTTKSAEVRAVFDGTVTSIIIIPGGGKVIMISHGAYRTVYSNLQEIYVSKGDKVTAKQKIGKLLPKEGTEISESHFELWKITADGPKKENPGNWIYRK